MPGAGGSAPRSASDNPCMSLPPNASPPQDAGAPAEFEPDSTQRFQARMPAAPVWFASMVAGNTREKNRLRSELDQMKSAVQLLAKKRNGGKWTPEDRQEIRRFLRSA